VTYRRVERRTITLAPNSEEFYYVALTLSNKAFSTGVGGAGPAGGNDPPPGVFPYQGTVPVLVQYKLSSGASVTFDQQPTPGNLLLGVSAVRTGSYGAWGTSIDTFLTGGSPQRNGSAVRRTVITGDTAAGPVSGGAWTVPNQSATCLMEWQGVTYDSHTKLNNHAASLSITYGGAHTPTPGSAGVIVGIAAIGDGDLDIISVAPPAGYTEVMDQATGGGPSPYGHAVYQIVSNLSGSYAPVGTATVNPGQDTPYGGLTIALTAAAGTSEPPLPAQWVYNQTPTPAPGGGRTMFYTLHPYADHSLRVYVDQMDQTSALTESNAEIGEFDLAFDPRSDEAITVYYQGR
jgi:hypothetical protein